MVIVNTRIDDRLIHGQIAVVWSLVTKANHVMVVDDLVVKDMVSKEALRMACPQQCKLSTLTAEKAAENLKAGKYDEEHVLVVTKNSKTIRGLPDHGFQTGAVNVGNMGGKQNTKMLKKIASANQGDIENLLYLANHGAKVTAQMVPTDEALDFVELIKKAEA